MEKWKRLGVLRVDKGHLLITDYPDDEGVQHAYGLRERLNYPTAIQLQYGRGMIVETGGGNGIYPVEVIDGEIEGRGRTILGIRIMFTPLEEKETVNETYDAYQLHKHKAFDMK